MESCKNCRYSKEQHKENGACPFKSHPGEQVRFFEKLSCAEEEDFDFDPTNIEHLCAVCLRHEAIMCGLCGMCAELNPHLI